MKNLNFYKKPKFYKVNKIKIFIILNIYLFIYLFRKNLNSYEKLKFL